MKKFADRVKQGKAKAARKRRRTLEQRLCRKLGSRSLDLRLCTAAELTSLEGRLQTFAELRSLVLVRADEFNHAQIELRAAVEGMGGRIVSALAKILQQGVKLELPK